MPQLLNSVGKALGNLFRPLNGGGWGGAQLGPGDNDEYDLLARGAAHAAAGPGPGSRAHTSSSRRRRSPLNGRAQPSGAGPKAPHANSHSSRGPHRQRRSSRGGTVSVTAAAAAGPSDGLAAANHTAFGSAHTSATDGSARADAAPAPGRGSCGGACTDACGSGGGDSTSPVGMGGAPNFFRASRASLSDNNTSAAGEALRQASMTARKAHFTRDNLVAYMRWVRASRGVLKLAGKANYRGPHPQLLLRCEHWLEVTDAQHRYGSNLRVYFDYWVAEMEAAELTPPPSPALMSPSPSQLHLAAMAAAHGHGHGHGLPHRHAAAQGQAPQGQGQGAQGHAQPERGGLAASEGSGRSPDAGLPPGQQQHQQQHPGAGARPSRFSGETQPHPIASHHVRVHPHVHPHAHVHVHRSQVTEANHDERRASCEGPGRGSPWHPCQGPDAQTPPPLPPASAASHRLRKEHREQQDLGCGSGCVAEETGSIARAIGFGSPCAVGVSDVMAAARLDPAALSPAGAEVASPTGDLPPSPPPALRQLQGATADGSLRPTLRRHSCGQAPAETPSDWRPTPRMSSDAIRRPAVATGCCSSAPGEASLSDAFAASTSASASPAATTGAAASAAPGASPRRSNHLCSPSRRFAMAAMIDMSPEAERDQKQEEAGRECSMQQQGDGSFSSILDLRRAGSLVVPAKEGERKSGCAGQLPPATPPPPFPPAVPVGIRGAEGQAADAALLTPPAVAAGLALSCDAAPGGGAVAGVGGAVPNTVLRAAKLLSNRGSVGNGSNFFRWLDTGPGLEVDLAHLGVPRAKLDAERVKYLSPHELLEYELDVELDTGLLRYKRSGKLLHTGHDQLGRTSVDEHRRPPTPPPPAVPLSLLGEGAAAWWLGSAAAAAAAAASAPPPASTEPPPPPQHQQGLQRELCGLQAGSRQGMPRTSMEVLGEGQQLLGAGGSGVLDPGPDPGLGAELRQRLALLAAEGAGGDSPASAKAASEAIAGAAGPAGGGSCGGAAAAGCEGGGAGLLLPGLGGHSASSVHRVEQRRGTALVAVVSTGDCGSPACGSGGAVADACRLGTPGSSGGDSGEALGSTGPVGRVSDAAAAALPAGSGPDAECGEPRPCCTVPSGVSAASADATWPGLEPWSARAPGSSLAPLGPIAAAVPPLPRTASVRPLPSAASADALAGGTDTPCTPTLGAISAAATAGACVADGSAREAPGTPPATPLTAAAAAAAACAAAGVRGAQEEKEKVTKWIYVVDPELRLFVHPKVRGRFHHSSFLCGGAVVAAGGLAARHGQLRLLTADSGHYWPREENFRWLCEHLVSVGADLSACELRSKHMPVPAATGRELMEKMGVPPPPWRLQELQPPSPSPSPPLQHHMDELSGMVAEAGAAQAEAEAVQRLGELPSPTGRGEQSLGAALA